MATIQKFEDLICWQKGRELTREIYKSFNSLSDFGFRDQIQRAAVSVMSNISEGFERGTRAEFINYLFIARGSAGEVRSQLYVAVDNKYLNDETFKRLNRLCQDCSVLIWKLIQSLKRSQFSGLQHKTSLPKNPLKELFEKEGIVMTPRGVMKKEEAERLGLEVKNL